MENETNRNRKELNENAYASIDKSLKKVPDSILKKAFTSAYPVQRMEKHGAEGRELDYIGSSRHKEIITDYYEDDHGEYWHKSRGIVAGKIVSMDEYIFGHRIKRKGKRRNE